MQRTQAIKKPGFDSNKSTIFFLHPLVFKSNRKSSSEIDSFHPTPANGSSGENKRIPKRAPWSMIPCQTSQSNRRLIVCPCLHKQFIPEKEREKEVSIDSSPGQEKFSRGHFNEANKSPNRRDCGVEAKRISYGRASNPGRLGAKESLANRSVYIEWPLPRAPERAS